MRLKASTKNEEKKSIWYFPCLREFVICERVKLNEFPCRARSQKRARSQFRDRVRWMLEAGSERCTRPRAPASIETRGNKAMAKPRGCGGRGQQQSFLSCSLPPSLFHDNLPPFKLRVFVIRSPATMTANFFHPCPQTAAKSIKHWLNIRQNHWVFHFVKSRKLENEKKIFRLTPWSLFSFFRKKNEPTKNLKLPSRFFHHFYNRKWISPYKKSLEFDYLFQGPEGFDDHLDTTRNFVSRNLKFNNSYSPENVGDKRPTNMDKGFWKKKGHREGAEATDWNDAERLRVRKTSYESTPAACNDFKWSANRLIPTK